MGASAARTTPRGLCHSEVESLNRRTPSNACPRYVPPAEEPVYSEREINGDTQRSKRRRRDGFGST
jgi:hypothetical protein